MVRKFQMFVESLKASGNKIDVYELEDFSATRVRELYKLVEINSYRAIATFSENMELFEEFPVTKIALLNYPSTRSTHHRFASDIDNLLKQGVADEIEFPWKDQYMSWKQEKWRDIILKCMTKGVILRPMLEVGVDTEEYLEMSVRYIKEIGITNIMTSTGLVPQVTTPEKFDSVKDIFPPIFNIKVSGQITDIETVNIFLSKGANLIATSVDILNSDLIVK